MNQAQLSALFRAELVLWQEAFGRRFSPGLGVFSEPCSPGSRCGYRDVAYADLSTGTVWFSSRALTWGKKRLLGLLRHELGHLADPTPSKPGAEKRADAIAFRVTGVPIRYDKRQVQTIGRGSLVRPANLHQ